jgi:hypothetical protein
MKDYTGTSRASWQAAKVNGRAGRRMNGIIFSWGRRGGREDDKFGGELVLAD